MNSDGERGGYIPRHSHNSYSSKMNNNNDSSNGSAGGSGGSVVSNSGNGYEKSQQQQQQERYLWEIRKRSPNTTPASTVLNSPDLTDIHYTTQHSHLHHYHHHPHPHQIRVGRSPVSQNDDDDDDDDNHQLSITTTTSPGESPTDIGNKTASIGLVREGEIVVFDDIDTNWRKTISSTNHHESDYHFYHHTQQHQQQQPQQQQQQPQQYHQQTINDDVLKVTKMIGQLPIAEYEGSPRRIGNHQQQHQQQYELSLAAQQQQQSQNNSNTNNISSSYGTKNCSNAGTSPSSLLFPPRPGFPQRISPSSSSNTAGVNSMPISMDNCSGGGGGGGNIQINDATIMTTMSAVATNKQNLIDIGDRDNSSSRSSNNDNEENINNKPKTPTFDYLYEFSETRKVLEEFFKGPNDDNDDDDDGIDKKFCDLNEGDDLGSCDTHQECKYKQENNAENAYIGQRLARIPNEEFLVHKSPRKQPICDDFDHNDIELYIDSNSRSSGELPETELGGGGGGGVNDGIISDNGFVVGSSGGEGDQIVRRHSRNFTLSPETTDYDSNCGDLDSLSNDINCQTDFGRLYTSMPVLEDGLSSGHASDTENNLSSTVVIDTNYLENMTPMENHHNNTMMMVMDTTIGGDGGCMKNDIITATTPSMIATNNIEHIMNNSNSCKNLKENNFDSIYSMNISQCTPPPPAPAPHRLPPPLPSSQPTNDASSVAVATAAAAVAESQDIQEALKDIRSALQRTKALAHEKTKAPCDEVIQGGRESPIWVPRRTLSHDSISNAVIEQCQKQQQQEQQCHDDDDADTDLETDRLLGQQRLDDQGFFDDKNWSKNSKIKSPLNSIGGSVIGNGTPITSTTTSSASANTIKPQTFSSATIRQGIGTALTPTSPEHCQIIGNVDISLTSPEKLQYTKSPTGSVKSKKDSTSSNAGSNNGDKKSKTRNKEGLLDPAVLIEGVLFRARYLGSTQLVCEGQPTKSTRMMQAEEAVSRIKAPEGESQPSTEVDLFISTEKIMVLNTDLKEIMMDHALRTISYIADIGDLVVLMARRRFVPSDNEEGVKPNRTPKMICHVFESDEAQFIAQSIGQAFQVAYMEFLKANGIEDHSFVKEMDYQEVLNSQEIFGDELEIFAKKELQKEVVVPKAKGEILGVVIVESGWGSMLPTVVIANLMSSGAAARCGQLNIGDQLIAINGLSLVGLPLSTCQSYIRNAKNQTAVKFTVVPCPPVVEVKIKRPNTKYQLGFSVQNGVICSLLRGGIAERGGVRVGHRIIEINNQSVVAVPHEKIVNLLATSVGEILMKTMPTSMFRLLTGQENPVYI